MSIAIRAATLDDMSWLLDQLAEFDQFFGSSRSLFPTMEQAERTLAGLIEEQVFLMAVNEREPLGFIAGVLVPHYLNPAITVLSELFWWVAVEHRGSRAGLVLLNAFDAIGDQRAHSVVMTLEADSPIHPKHLYGRGYRLKETSFLREVA